MSQFYDSLGYARIRNLPTLVPGYVETDTWKPLLANEEIRAATTKKMEETTSGGWIESEEVGDLVSFLLSKSGRSITGQTIDIDRGWHLQ